MCILGNFMEDALLDAEYQDYLYRKNKERNEMWEESDHIEQTAYEIMLEQANKDQEEFETAMLEREYRKIQEWELMKEMAETDFQYCN